jgi:hypothetical protein
MAKRRRRNPEVGMGEYFQEDVELIVDKYLTKELNARKGSITSDKQYAYAVKTLCNYLKTYAKRAVDTVEAEELDMMRMR